MITEKYIAVPNPNWSGKQVACIITRCFDDNEDRAIFLEQLAEATGKGYTIQNCGINGTARDNLLAWAILTAKVIEDIPPKEEENV